MSLLSVIVPVYNVSQYLREALDSILNQAMEDIEVICVDDRSTDDSLAILEEYKRKDGRIRVYANDRNRGVSYTRNFGMSKAAGEYVHFFDPDDVVDECIYTEMLKAKTDVIICNYEKIPLSNRSIPFVHEGCYSSADYFKELSDGINMKGKLCFSWRCLYRLSFLRKYRLCFNEGLSMGEDTIFNMEAFLCAETINVVSTPLYRYRTNNSGASRMSYKPRLEQSLQLQIAEKKRICAQYHVDEMIPFTKEMSEDIVKRYTMMLFANIKNNPNGESLYEGIKRVLNMPMIREAIGVVGFRNIYSNWKEYVFYLCMKFRMASVVVKFL